VSIGIDDCQDFHRTVFVTRLAIIGASGEVGFRLIQRLSGRYHINAIVRDPAKRDFIALNNVDVHVVNDISDIDALKTAFENCIVVINAAYIHFAQKIHEALSGAGDNTVQQVIFTGSTGIYTKLESRSAQDKMVAEAFIRDRFTVPWTILRATMIYGHADDRNFGRLLKFINRSVIVPVIGDGSALIQPVYIFDLVELMDRSILNRSAYNHAFDVAGAKAYSSYKIFRLCADLLGKRRVFVKIHYRVIQMAIALLEQFGKAPLSQEQVLRFMEDKHVDISPAEQQLAFSPTGIEEGLQKQIGDMRREGYV
jgi:nucleoside-diphosphate-sugar epimerase